MYIIYRFIHNRVYYWNTCGWSQCLLSGRRYTLADAGEAESRMTIHGLRVSIAPFKARAGL
jgi:hypothetical protein